MTGFLEDGLLRSMFDFTDQDIAKLNAGIADLQNLIAVYKAHRPQIDRVQNELVPLINKIIAKERSL